MRRVIALVACVGVVALGTVAAGTSAFAQTAQEPTAEIPEYQLGSGDKVRVTTFGEESLTGEFQIGGTGKISLPLIGEIDALGVTARQLQDRIESALKQGYLKDPHVSVEVLNYRPFYILGEVKNPGSYPYVNGMTAINAVALAGGFSYRSREDDFYIARGSERHRQKYLGHPDTPLMPGDVVTVRERYF
jgi:polysaccharide export outer membrane protein